MERRLQSVRKDNQELTTTLRHIAGEQDDINAVEYFLRQKMAHIALFISAATVYEIDEGTTVARALNDLTGGFIAYYDELQQLPIIRAAPNGSSLGVVDDSRVIACFSPQNVAIDEKKRLRRDEALLGSLPPYIGIDLDQAIEIGSFGGSLQPVQPALHIVR